MDESSQPRARTFPCSLRLAVVTSGRLLLPRVTWKTRTAGGAGGKSRTKAITSFKLARLVSWLGEGGRESKSSTGGSAGQERRKAFIVIYTCLGRRDASSTTVTRCLHGANYSILEDYQFSRETRRSQRLSREASLPFLSSSSRAAPVPNLH